MSSELDKKHLIFVYGTLRKGGKANYFLKGARWVGSAKIHGALYKIDWYPGVIRAEKLTKEHPAATWVLGDVYEVGDVLLAKLDDYEGCTPQHNKPHEYQRVQTQVKTPDENLTVQFWEYAWQVNPENHLPHGDWLSKA